MDINPVDTSSFTPDQLDKFNAANKLGTGVPVVPVSPGTQTIENKTNADKQANVGKPGYDVFGNPVATGGTTTVGTTSTTSTSQGGNGTVGGNYTGTASTVDQLRQQGGTRTGADGKTYYNYDNTPVGATPTTSTPTTSTSTPSTGNASIDALNTQNEIDRQTILKDKQDAVTAANNFNTLQTNIQNGAVPLNAGQQAQVDGLTQQFNQLIQQQQLTNTGATGLANTRGFQTGAAEYDSKFQTSTIQSIASAGAAKISDLQIKMASAVASLTQSFKDANISQAKTAYDTLKAAQSDLDTAIQKHVDETQAAIASAQKVITDQRDYQLNVDKFNQTVADTAFTQDLETQKFTQQKKQDLFDNAYKTEDLALKKRANAIAAQQIQVPNVQVTATGAPNPADQKAFLATLPPATATAVQQLTSYQMNPADFSSRSVGGGISQKQQMMTLAHQFDPTFDENQYAARATFLKSMTGSTPSSLGAAITAANKSINHLDAFTTSVQKVGNVSVPFVSGALNTVESIFSTSKQTNLNQASTEAAGLKDELAKFFKGSGTTDVGSIETWGKQLDPNATPAQLKGTVQGAITLLSGQLDAVNQQYVNTMGKPPTNPLLNPEAMQKLSNLKNQGYEVNVPGVLYTDKDAYMKAEPDAASKLTQARQMLINANDPNNPPTSDNILQLAQMQ